METTLQTLRGLFVQKFDSVASELRGANSLSLADLERSLDIRVEYSNQGLFLASLTAPVDLSLTVMDPCGSESPGLVECVGFIAGRTESEARFYLAKMLSGRELVFCAGSACSRALRLPEVVDTQHSYAELTPEERRAVVANVLFDPNTGEKLRAAEFVGPHGRFVVRCWEDESVGAFTLFDLSNPRLAYNFQNDGTSNDIRGPRSGLTLAIIYETLTPKYFLKGTK